MSTFEEASNVVIDLDSGCHYEVNFFREKVFQHAYFEAKKDLGLNSNEIEFVVLLFANAATLTSEMINNGIKILRNDKSFDSAVSTSIYNMWSPMRSLKITFFFCYAKFMKKIWFELFWLIIKWFICKIWMF